MLITIRLTNYYQLLLFQHKTIYQQNLRQFTQFPYSKRMIKIISLYYLKLPLLPNLTVNIKIFDIIIYKYCIASVNMKFEDFSQKTCCPYNKNHIFDKSKYLYHLNRCKDKEKVGHLFANCQYNRTHIVPKEDIETHQITCSDRQQLKKLTDQLRNTLQIVERERQRSREKVKKEQIKVQTVKKEVDPTAQHIHYEDCSICASTVNKLQEIKKVVAPQILAKIKTVQKMIKMNNQFISALKQLDQTKQYQQNNPKQQVIPQIKQ